MSAKNSDHYRNKLILAPMVRIGTLPIRLLSLRYGADLVYSEEIIDWRLLRSKRVKNEMLGTTEYVDETDGSLVFSTCEEEKSRLILQIGTSDPDRAVQVLLKMQDLISGIDVNMGCPKEFSLKGGMGAALLTQPEKVKAILSALVKYATIPVTCKIRVLPTIEETLELALLIQSCGVSAVAIHGRNINERPQHANRSHFIKAIAEKLEIPVIANGGSKEISCYEDILKFRAEAGASSVMVARAGEWNPSIFRPEGKLDIEIIIKAFIKESILSDNPFQHTKYTIQNILRDLQETPRGRVFLSSQTMNELCDIWELQDFYKDTKLKWEEFKKKHKRPADEDIKDPKKPKLDMPFDKSIICVPDCEFIRKHYSTNESLPKSILLKWTIKESFGVPKYSMECSDKKFLAIVEVGGRKFMTDVWEKSKKLAEQGAAFACCRYLKLMEKKIF
ncbi:tRNA-dihydrouridine(20) synthase [NAD(P)+]-like [Folsomia candida]|nr:tRNA-dihydrouridine(20) synthase [NAD(P)+]-like [Folsomia candida]